MMEGYVMHGAICMMEGHYWRGGICIHCGDRLRCGCGRFVTTEGFDKHLKSDCPLARRILERGEQG